MRRWVAILLVLCVVIFGYSLIADRVTPITDGSGAAFVSRVIDVALSSLYALAGVALLLPHKSAVREPVA